MRFIPKIVQFLEYFPQETRPETLGQKLSIARRLLGLSQEALARRLGVDPGTLGRWERGWSKPSKKFLETLTAFLSSLPSDIGRPSE